MNSTGFRFCYIQSQASRFAHIYCRPTSIFSSNSAWEWMCEFLKMSVYQRATVPSVFNNHEFILFILSFSFLFIIPSLLLFFLPSTHQPFLLLLHLPKTHYTPPTASVRSSPHIIWWPSARLSHAFQKPPGWMFICRPLSQTLLRMQNISVIIATTISTGAAEL